MNPVARFARTALALVPIALVATACGPKESATESPASAPAASAPAASAPQAAEPARTPEPASVPAKVEVAGKPGGTKPGTLVAGFRATAHTYDGDAVRDAAVDSQAMGAPTVWIVSSSTCPFTKKYAPLIASMELEYQAKGVKFVHVYPNRTESVESKRKFHKARGLHGAWIEDQDATIAKLVAAKKTPEIVLAKADGTIAYRGAIDDSGGDVAAAESHYLRDALEAVLAGRDVAVQETVPAG